MMRYRSRLYKRCLLLISFCILYYAFKWTSSTETTDSQYSNVNAEEQIDRRGLLGRIYWKIFKVENKSCKTKDLLVHDLPSGKDTWLPVDDENTGYVFSAYYVVSKKKIVIIGTRAATDVSLICLLVYKYTNGSYSSVKVETGHIKLPEGRALRYSTYIFTCDLKGQEIPDYVSLVSTKCYRPYHLMNIQSVITSEKPQRTFTVCLSPINNNFSNHHQLIEWIEMNRITGAQKFVIYNHSSNSEVGKVLDFYSKRGITEVIQWNLPTTLQRSANNVSKIHYYGQEAAINDCLYREKQYSEFVVYIDLDEFIIPRKEKMYTWSDVLNHAKKESGAYMVRNTFFRKDWTNNDVTIANKEMAENFKLITLQTLEREAKVFPLGHRSKCFVRTSIAERVAIHSVPALHRVHRIAYIPEAMALLHHYRSWEGVDHGGTMRKVDKTLPDKYGDILINNVKRIWSELTL